MLLPLLLATLGAADAFRILGLFPHPGRSHHMVFEPLLDELTAKGHNLTIMSYFPRENPPPNYRDISLVGMHPVFVNIVEGKLFEQNFLGIRRLNHVPAVWMLADFATTVCELLLDWPPAQELFAGNEEYDVILLEVFNSNCALGITNRFKAPIVGLLSHQILPWTAYRARIPENPSFVPQILLSLSDEMSLLERLENTFFTFYYKNWFRNEVQAKEQIMLEKKFGHPLPDLREIQKNISVLLVNAHHTVNGERPLVPGTIEVGGLHIPKSKRNKEIPKDLQKILDEAEHGVVVFSFGSMVKVSSLSQHILDSFFKAFARIPQAVIWKWEADDGNVTLKPDNVHLVKWLPQYELLKHPKTIATIAHGGMLSTTEAVSVGKPMLLVPFYGDQMGNSAQARRVGIAEVLDLMAVTEKTFYNALVKVLSPEMRAQAKRVSAAWHDRPRHPLDEAAYWVERTARLGPVTTPNVAKNLPDYSIALLDVAALLLVILAVLSLFAYTVILVLVRLVKTFISGGKVKTQ